MTKTNQQIYEERIAEYNDQMDANLGSTVLTPAADEESAVYTWFHRLMTECGLIGVEYAQEAYHMDSQYLSGFQNYQDVLADLTFYVKESDTHTAFAHIHHNECGGHTARTTSNDPDPPDPDRYGNMRVQYECLKCLESFTAVIPPKSANKLLPKGFEDRT